MFFDESTGTIYAAFRYPGFVEHVGTLNTRDGSHRALADIKRAMHYRVSSVAWDSSGGTLFYTNDNLALRDLMAVDVATGKVRMLLEDARIGEMVVNPVDHSLVGIRHCQRDRDTRPHPAAVRHVERRSTCFRTKASLTTSTSRRTASCCRRR